MQTLVRHSNCKTASKLVVVSGFSPFASRNDLDLLLDGITPLSVDAILNKYMYPFGKWAIHLHTDEVAAVKRRLDSFPVPGLQCVEASSSILRKAGRLASDCGISSSTVRLRNIPKEVGEEELRYFFHEFALRDRPFELRSAAGQPYRDLSFVTFAAPEEAARAVIHKNYRVVLGRNVFMLPYLI